MLTGPAVHLLDDDTDDLVDGDDIAKFRAALRKLGVPFHIEGAPAAAADWNARRPSGGPGHRGRDRRDALPRHALSRVLMATFLHLVKRDSAALAGAVIEANLREADARVTVVLLDGARPRRPSPRASRSGASPPATSTTRACSIWSSLHDHVITW